MAANRLLALLLAVVIGLGLYLGLTRTRIGTAVRAVAVDPVAAQLVAIDVRTASALAFALGGALVAAAGVLVSMFLTFNANLGVVFTLKALVVVIMGGVGNLLGALIAGLILGLVENYVAVFVDPGLTLAATYAIFLLVLLVRPQGLLGRSQPMSGREMLGIALAAVAVAVLACVPLMLGDYGLSLAINIVSYTVLATAWSLFSGPTRYVSLATVAFFGIGAYTTAVFVESLAWPLVLLIAAGVSVVVAAIVGLVDAAAERRLLRDLQLRPGRAGPPARHLVRGQQDPHARPLRLHRHHRGADLLAAPGARRAGVRHRLPDRPLAARPGACAPSATTRPWRAIPASTPRAPRSRCSCSAPCS